MYKKNAASNRDALFGGASTTTDGGGGGGGRGGKKNKKSRSKKQTTTTPRIPSSSSSSTTRTTTLTTTTTRYKPQNTKSQKIRSKPPTPLPTSLTTPPLTGQIKLNTLQTAESHRARAKKAMTSTLFSKPDPISASTHYAKAAELYGSCGEYRLEKLHRIASADCQMGQDAYATAAGEYCRAAELSRVAEGESLEVRRREVWRLYGDAAKAWGEVDGERSRMAECMMEGAFGLLMDDDDEEDEVVQGFASERKKKVMDMKKDALSAIEEAIEVYVPDVFNRYASFRQTGHSAYLDPNTTEASYETMELAKQNTIQTSYAHEPIQRAMYTLISYGEIPSALYASGAATYILASDVDATISVSRSFVSETVLALALGDVVLAERMFLQVHLQRNSYLSSRECKLSEDLIRCVKEMDAERLDVVRGEENRAAVGNMDLVLRDLVLGLKVSGGGVLKRKKKVSVVRQQEHQQQQQQAVVKQEGTSKGGGERNLEGEELQAELDANYAEMEELMDSLDDLGMDDDDDDDAEDDEDDDDDFDLR